MTVSSQDTNLVFPLLETAWKTGYERIAVHDRDYLVVVKAATSAVDGFFLITASQRRKLDEFEGEIYKAVAVAVHLERHGDDNICTAKANMYLEREQ